MRGTVALLLAVASSPLWAMLPAHAYIVRVSRNFIVHTASIPGPAERLRCLMDLGFFRSLSGSPLDTPGGQQESRRRGRRPFLLIILALAVIVSSGCGGLVMPFTKTESYASGDSLVLKQQRSDVLEAVSEVGKAMGFSVSSFDRAR